MSESPDQPHKAPASGDVASRILYGMTALAALVGAGYFAKVSLTALNDANTPALLKDHAPALIGLPIVVALTTAFVCCARSLERQFQIEFLGLRTEGAGAVILCWIGVFAAVTLALRGLW